MTYIDHVLSTEEIKEFNDIYKPYAKITADLGKGTLGIGCELHVDGEEILLEKGGKQDDIWGGGLNFEMKEFDATAVLNIRPRLNNSIEILDVQRREKFFEVVKKTFHNI